MINFVPPGKLNGLYGPYYGFGSSPGGEQPVDTAAIIAAQNEASMQAAEMQAAQFEQMQEYQREREAFALSQRDNETQIAMMEQSIQEAMESILAGEIDAQTEQQEEGQLMPTFTQSLLDAMANYGTAAPDTGGGQTGTDPNAPTPGMGGNNSITGRPV